MMCAAAPCLNVINLSISVGGNDLDSQVGEVFWKLILLC